MKKRKARAPRRRPAPSRPKRLSVAVAERIGATALRLKRAKLVFAHGTSDPVAEAAFLVGETLGIHPDHVDARAGMASPPRREEDFALQRRIHPQARGLSAQPIYMRSVPFTSTNARSCALLPWRNLTAKRLLAKLFAVLTLIDRTVLISAPVGMSRDPRCAAVSRGKGRRSRTFQRCHRGRPEKCRRSPSEETRSVAAWRPVRAAQSGALRSYYFQSAVCRSRRHGGAAAGMPA